MKMKLILFILIIPFVGITQNKKYTVSGTTFYMSHYQGGAENPYPPKAFPREGVTLYVVELVANKKSKQVGKITSESDGSFKIKLPLGEYGFVLKEDLHSLTVGQFLPKGWSKGNMMESSSSSWSIKGNQPVQIIDKDVSGIIITNYEIQVCGMCP